MALDQRSQSLRQLLLCNTKSAWRAISLGGVSGFLLAWGAFYYNNRNFPPLLAIFIFSVGGILNGFFWRQVLINSSIAQPKPNWALWVVVLVDVCLTVLGIYFEPGPPAKPLLTLSLQIGDSPGSVVTFTNPSLRLMRRNIIGTRTNLLATLFARNCLLIPLGLTQSSAIFTFAVRNNSAVTVTDCVFAVAFPKAWRGFLEPGWRDVNLFMITPEADEVYLTNMQCWASPLPLTLYPTNRYHLPSIEVDNAAPPNEQSNRVDGIAFHMRGTGIDAVYFTYVFFFRTASPMKPFFSPIETDLDGRLKFLITTQQVLDLQK